MLVAFSVGNRQECWYASVKGVSSTHAAGAHGSDELELTLILFEFEAVLILCAGFSQQKALLFVR
jgi:hypothetical protein